jgi:hypothetical protein
VNTREPGEPDTGPDKQSVTCMHAHPATMGLFQDIPSMNNAQSSCHSTRAACMYVSMHASMRGGCCLCNQSTSNAGGYPHWYLWSHCCYCYVEDTCQSRHPPALCCSSGLWTLLPQGPPVQCLCCALLLPPWHHPSQHHHLQVFPPVKVTPATMSVTADSVYCHAAHGDAQCPCLFSS